MIRKTEYPLELWTKATVEPSFVILVNPNEAVHVGTFVETTDVAYRYCLVFRSTHEKRPYWRLVNAKEILCKPNVYQMIGYARLNGNKVQLYEKTDQTHLVSMERLETE